MPEEDSARSTDLVDVLRGALAAPWLRVLTVWLVSAAGTAPAVFLDEGIRWIRGARVSSGYGYPEHYDSWLVVLGVPISFIGSIVAGSYNEYLRPNAFEWINRILFLAAILLWLRATIRVCAGRWLATSVCHLFAASFVIATGRWADSWWIGFGLSAAMVVVWFKWPGFRQLRATEAEYELDGL